MSLKLETGNLILDLVSPGVSIRASRHGCSPTINPNFVLGYDETSCATRILTSLGKSQRQGNETARPFPAHATLFAGSSLWLGRPLAWRRFLVSSFQFPVSVSSVEPATQFSSRHRMGD